VQHNTSRYGIEIRDMVRLFPNFLCGHEGEGAGSGTPPPTSGSGPDPATPPSAPAPTTEPVTKPDPKVETFDAAYVETLRQESAGYRTKLKELEDKETERAKAELSETDRAKAEAVEEKGKRETAEKALLDERKRIAVISEAAKLKFLDPEDALAHLDLTDIRMNEDGTPHKTSVESAVKKIADTKKYLISGPGSADGGAGGTPPVPSADKLKEIEQDIVRRGGVKVPAI